MQNNEPVAAFPQEQKIAQELFDKQYITASEMMKYLNISRAGFLYGRRSGKVPPAISLNEGRLFVWEREKVQPLLDVWKASVVLHKAG